MGWYSDWQCQERRSDSNKNVKSKQAIGLIICAKQDSTRRNKKTTISSFFFKTQMLFPRIQIQENTPSSSKARQNNRDENWKDTNILFKKIPPAAGSQRTPRCSRRLQLNMTAISGWQFSGKLLKTLPKRLYIYIYIYRLYKCQSHFFKYVFSLLV